LTQHVTPRPVTVSAVAATKTYGDPDPALTTTSTNFVATDLGPGLITFSASRAAGDTVGSYLLTAAASDSGTGRLANYTVTFNTASFTITPRPVTIAADAKTKTFGSADPPLTYQITSGTLAFADVFTGALVRDPGEDVGTYAIKQGTVALSANYTLTFVGAVLTITKATPTVIVAFTPNTVTFDGLSHPATVTIVAVNSAILTPGVDGAVTFAYTQNGVPFIGIPTDPGAYAASAHFTSTNPNYTDGDSAADASLTINPAPAEN